jgi:hypothetical protein
MRGECERHVKATEFRIPEYADKPSEPGAEPEKKSGKKQRATGD